VARAVRGQPVRPRPPVGPPAGAGDRNYFASVVDELRKVVWPTWNELGRMTGVVVTTVILMAVIVSAADYGLGFVVKQLYASSSPAAGSQVTAQPSQVKPSTPATAAPTSAGGSTAPVSP
jgi:preprotein translocase SecE subunit